MALSNYQFQFGSFVLGAGTPFQIQQVDGLAALPALRVQDDVRGFNDGMLTGRDFFGGRTISLIVVITAGNGNTAQANYNLFKAALQPQTNGTTTMQFLLSPADLQMTIQARVRAITTAINPEYTYGLIKTQVSFFCPDPRYYQATSTSLAMAPTTAPGRTYNRTYNLTFGGGSQTGSVTVANTGWTTTYPVITLNGPITNPTITNASTNQYLTVNTTLGASDVLVYDLLNKIITLNGSPARNYLTGNSLWFGCAPGNTIVSLSGTNTTIGTTAASLVYSPAYI